MDYENLMKSMDESADEKKGALIEKAKEGARGIEDEARPKADEIVKAHLSRASHALEVDRNRFLYEARSEARRESAAIKHEYLSRAFDIAEEGFKDFRYRDGYEDFFRRTMLEAVEGLGEKEFIIHIDARDEQLCWRVMGQTGLDRPVKADISSAGGLNVSTPDGKVIVFNCLESRLKAAKERHGREIFSTLFGD